MIMLTMSHKTEVFLVVVIAIIALVALVFLLRTIWQDTVVGRALFAEYKPCRCENIYEPVCGEDGNNYMNGCLARCHKTEIRYRGYCATS